MQCRIVDMIPTPSRAALLLAFALWSPAFVTQAAEAPTPSGPQTDGPFHKVILDSDKALAEAGKFEDSIVDPMEMSIAKDGRVFYAQRDGTVKLLKPGQKEALVVAKVPVFTGLEDGMLGITLDPNFLKNGWVYLNHSLPETQTDDKGRKSGIIRVSRYTFKDDQIDLSTEKTIIDIPTQRDECCHVGGSLTFDTDGNLYVSIGDNTNPFASDGFSPIDEREGRSAWDAQKSAANANDLRGKILRVKPKAEGGYTIPKGNLFPPGTTGTRPEVYVMGNRNPFRISVDPKTRFLYWGEVGPDAGGFSETRGPAGHDEINQARKAGFFGWPYFVGDNKAYWHWDFTAKTNDFKYDVEKPVNNSPNTTGIKNLPPAQAAFIYYTHGPSTKFPVVNAGGGRTAMAGPVYYFDKSNKSPHKLPAEYDHTLFIYEWSRNWIIAVHLDDTDHIKSMERFCPNMTFKRPMDLELGPDGCLYLIEYGTAWSKNLDTQIVRLEYHAP